jgi:DNA primase
MSIPEAEIARVKATRSVLEFLQDPKRSGRCYKARCPLPGHDDRTPSFYLYPDGGYWCFGCGRGGRDIISFAFQYWDLSWPKDFPVALARLGARPDGRSTAAPFLPPPPTAPVLRREVWPRLPDAATLAVYRVAAMVWQRALWKPTGRDALDYLRRRGLPDGLVRREGTGVATNTLAGALRCHGLDRSVAQQAGLLHANGHEVFAGRVVLWEWRRVGGVRTPVWATARLYQAGAAWDDAPKYLNVRGDRPLIGLEDVLGVPTVAVVEGIVDRLALLSFGEPAVALGSNDPPEGVLAELRRLARRSALYLVRDGDRAGRRGSWATLYKLDAPPAARLVVVDLPSGIKDPGELAERPDGAALYATAKRQGRRISPEHLKRRCECLHAVVARRRASTSARLHRAGRLWEERE